MRERISHSKLFDIQTCGEYYRRRHEENERAPGTLWMLRGSAMDAVANVSHTRQWDAKQQVGATPEALVGALPSVKEGAELAVTAFEERVAAEGVTVTKQDAREAGSEDSAVGRTKDSVALLGAGYVRLVAPKVNPIAVQRKIECAPAAVDFEIVGVLDLIEETRDGVERVVDNKAPRRRPRKDAAAKSEQLIIYSMLRAAETRRIPKAALRHVVQGSRFVEVDEQEVQPTAEDMRAMLARAETAVAAIRAGIHVPAQSGHWRCSATYCEFWETCRFAIGRSRP